MAKKTAKNKSVAGELIGPLPWFLFKTGARFHELKGLIEAGNLFALIDAIQLADELERAPKWLNELARTTLYDLILEQKAYSGWQQAAGKYRRAMKHLDRWRVVRQVVLNGTPWVEAYAEAVELLKKTPAAGSESAVRDSYRLVNKDLKNPKKWHLYYPATSKTRKLASLPHSK